MNIYYVYAYLRESDNTPYYIGKGKGNRMFASHKHIPVPKDKSRIVTIAENLCENEALALEIETIKLYGRKNNRTGILRNLTDGGEGCSGMIHSEITRATISETTKSQFLDPVKKARHSEGLKKHYNTEEGRETQRKRNQIPKRRRSLESRQKTSEALKGKNIGKKRTDEEKMHLSKCWSGKTWKLIEGKRVWMSKNPE